MQVLTQLPGYVRNHVHDVGIIFDHQRFLYFDAAV
ncbi:Uncharacterised protein [Mycobacterium tuberculosis]|nr:Uncharacterised protein [Mycobacterium tuberculosis]